MALWGTLKGGTVWRAGYKLTRSLQSARSTKGCLEKGKERKVIYALVLPF